MALDVIRAKQGWQLFIMLKNNIKQFYYCFFIYKNCIISKENEKIAISVLKILIAGKS